MTEVQQTQELIVQKLEESGKLGKMRAMVTEASLAAINAEEEDMFTPSKKLKEVKSSPDGVAALALVHDFLKTLGLAYTSKVLEMESSLPSERLPVKNQLVARFGGDAPDGKPLLFKVMADAENAPISAEPVNTAAKSSMPSAAPAKSANKYGSVSSSDLPATTAAPAVNKYGSVSSSDAPAPAVNKYGSVSSSDLAATSAPAVNKYGSVSSSDLSSAAPVAAAPKPAAVSPADKPDDDLYYISKFENRELYRFDKVQGQQVQMEYLKNCKVYILDEVDSITVDDCEDTEIVIAACEGSVFLRTCQNCKVTTACKQLRTRDCEHLDIRLFAGTDPVVESSHDIIFRPYNLKAPKLIQNFKEARLDAKMNRFPHIYDFTAEDPKIPQPHFILKYPEHELEMVSVGAQFGTPECPPEIVDMLEYRIEPAASSESGQNKSYNIKTGAKQWAELANAGDGEDEEKEDAKPAAETPVGGGPSTKLPPTPAQTAAAAAPAPAAVPVPSMKPPRGDSDSDYSSFNDDTDDDGSEKMSYSTDSDTF